MWEGDGMSEDSKNVRWPAAKPNNSEVSNLEC